MSENKPAFDLSKVQDSTYYARKNGQIVACRFNKLGVQRATIPTDRPHIFIQLLFADGETENLYSRMLPPIFFTAEEAINNENCIREMQVCGYHRGVQQHGYRFAKETLDNGNNVNVCYVWNKDDMEAVKVADLPLFDYVNGTFHASKNHFHKGEPLKVYRTKYECLHDNLPAIKVVEFNDTEPNDGNDTHNIVFLGVLHTNIDE